MNNQEKNTYVRNQILTTLLEMMKTESFNSITISDLVAKAEVGRLMKETSDELIAMFENS